MKRTPALGSRLLAAALGVALLAPAAAAQEQQTQETQRQNGIATEPEARPGAGPGLPQRAQRARQGSKGEIVFVNPEIDLGEVLDTEKPTAEFRFKSIGPGPITLTRIKPDCGCTVATLIKITRDEEGNEVREEIDAKTLPKGGVFEEGDEGIIKATYDATKRQGMNRRNVRVNTDSNKQRNVSVQLAVNVKPLVFADPRVITFGNAIKKGDTPSRVVRVYGRNDGEREEQFKVTRATLSNLVLNKKVDIEIVAHGVEEYEGEELPYSDIKMTLGAGIKPGVISDKLFVRTNDLRRPVFEVQVIGRILGNVEIEPGALRLGRMNPEQTVTHEFRASSRDGTPFNITGVSLDTDVIELTSTFKPVDPTNPTEWIVTIEARGVQANQRVNSKLKIETDVPLEETVDVRFYAVVGQ